MYTSCSTSAQLFNKLARRPSLADTQRHVKIACHVDMRRIDSGCVEAKLSCRNELKLRSTSTGMFRQQDRKEEDGLSLLSRRITTTSRPARSRRCWLHPRGVVLGALHVSIFDVRGRVDG